MHFVAQIEAMYAAGVRTFIEVGPQGVLTNFVKKILPGKNFCAIAMDNKQHHGLTNLWNALGQLAVNGVVLDFQALWQEYAEPMKPELKGKKLYTQYFRNHLWQTLPPFRVA